ncbi:hypothetical protein GCM10023339_41490 [Alloalcanivorax gelatiniphagus]
MVPLEPLHPGKSYELTYSKTNGGRGQVVAKLVAISFEHLELVAPDGRTIYMPLRAVERAADIEALNDSSRTQKALAKLLTDALGANEQETVARLNLLASAIADVEHDISSPKTAARATAARELADAVREQLASSGPMPEALERRIRSSSRRAIPRPGFRATPGSLLDGVLRLSEELVAISDLASGTGVSVKVDFLPPSPPRIVTRDAITVTRGHDNEFDLQVRVTLDQHCAAITNVRLVLDKFRNLKNIGAAPYLRKLEPGETHVLRQRMRDNREQGARGDVKIDAHLVYSEQGGRTRQTARQSLDLRIYGKEQHRSIPNPFRAYAGGLPIENSEMFFGREDLVAEFVRDLQRAPGGRCFTLYGQQRTGKSSVLEQVKVRLTEDRAVVATLSMGILDRRSMTIDFIEEVLDQWRVQIDSMLPSELAGRLLTRWPAASEIDRNPLKSLRRARQAAIPILRSAGLTAVPFVVIVDEFTYLYEIFRRRGVAPSEQNELRDFMRQLKSLLEGRIFSALLIGQDTMPTFLGAFPNEFSVMSTARLHYLSQDETQALADDPVRKPDGQSRYSGYALSTIAAYTDGHPFFTQILCDRILTMVNARRRSEISESDVEEAVETLIDGQEMIEPHKFDCLVSADNTQALIADMVDGRSESESSSAQEVLMRIALLSGSQNNPVPVDRLDLNLKQAAALQDLRIRGVLRETEGGVAIRVLLYADYLRRRQE